MKYETVTLTFDTDVLYTLMIIAHERDVTLNQLANMVLELYIKECTEANED
jgi:hypothetical protein